MCRLFQSQKGQGLFPACRHSGALETVVCPHTPRAETPVSNELGRLHCTWGACRLTRTAFFARSLAGVGIFFQQDSDTNEVFVKTIVKGG